MYAFWTIRGKRPVTLTLDKEAKVDITDVMNNTRTLAPADKKVTVTIDPSVTYVTFRCEHSTAWATLNSDRK